MTKTVVVLIGTALSTLVAMSPVGATSECAVEVAQPLRIEESIFVSTVTYAKFRGSWVPGYPVQLVGEKSWVTDELGKPADRNVAARAGIRTGYDSYHDRGELFGDTLRVWVDVAGLTDTTVAGFSQDRLVAATVECVLLTAWWSRFGYDMESSQQVEAKWLRLDVRGSPRYASLAGVFSFAALGELPRRRQF